MEVKPGLDVIKGIEDVVYHVFRTKNRLMSRRSDCSCIKFVLWKHNQVGLRKRRVEFCRGRNVASNKGFVFFGSFLLSWGTLTCSKGYYSLCCILISLKDWLDFWCHRIIFWSQLNCFYFPQPMLLSEEIEPSEARLTWIIFEDSHSLHNEVITNFLSITQARNHECP